MAADVYVDLPIEERVRVNDGRYVFCGMMPALDLISVQTDSFALE